MQETISQNLVNYFGKELAAEIEDAALVKEFAPNTELIRPGQYVKVVPFILSGAVKVFSCTDEKELLLYYIQPAESCIMSFSACLSGEKSKIHAVTEKQSTLLLLPSEKIAQWVAHYPVMNKLFYRQYEVRYADLINTINHLLFDRLDKRLLDYLSEKVAITGQNPVKLSHREIASELGTAREVVSRLVKKMEKQQLLHQYPDGIQVL